MTINDLILGHVYRCHWDKDDTEVYYNVCDSRQDDRGYGRCIHSSIEGYAPINWSPKPQYLKTMYSIEDLGPEEQFVENYPELFV